MLQRILFSLKNQVIEVGKAFASDGFCVNYKVFFNAEFLLCFYLSARHRRILIRLGLFVLFVLASLFP